MNPKDELTPPTENLRSMDTAPKDGTPILGFVPSYYQGRGAWVVVLWMGDKGMRDAGWMDNRAWLVKPQGWLPLPELPKRKTRGYLGTTADGGIDDAARD